MASAYERLIESGIFLAMSKCDATMYTQAGGHYRTSVLTLFMTLDRFSEKNRTSKKIAQNEVVAKAQKVSCARK